MSEYLINLLPELKEQIFGYCSAADLRNLSCCSALYKEVLRETLWRHITIPWEYLLNPESICDDEHKLENLRFTRVLHFIVNVGWRYQGEYIKNYKHILNHCNPVLLQTLVIDRHIGASVKPELPFCFEEIDIQCIKLAVQALTNLKRFTIMYMKITEESLEAIGKLHNLSELNLCNHSICDFKFSIICERLKKLKLLSVESNYCINNIGLIHIVNLKSIEELTLSKCSFSDLGLTQICSLITLKKLNLNRCHNITDQGIPVLTKLVLLSKLDLSHCFKVTDAGVYYISTILTLQHVNLNYCMRVTDYGILELSKLTNLKCLKIASTGITDVGLKGLCNLKFLVQLKLTRCTKISDLGVSHLANLISLRKLNISGTKVTDAAILNLHPVKSLRELSISGCHKIADTGLAHLCSLAHLQALDISYTKVTIDGLKYLTLMTSLRTLKCHHSIFCSALDLEFKNVIIYCVDSSDEQNCSEKVEF